MTRSVDRVDAGRTARLLDTLAYLGFVNQFSRESVCSNSRRRSNANVARDSAVLYVARVQSAGSLLSPQNRHMSERPYIIRSLVDWYNARICWQLPRRSSRGEFKAGRQQLNTAVGWNAGTPSTPNWDVELRRRMRDGIPIFSAFEWSRAQFANSSAR